jgi:hypothetical protein
MGQRYKFNNENDELLLEAERAFDLSARRESMMNNRPAPSEPVHKPGSRSLAALLALGANRTGDTHVGS